MTTARTPVPDARAVLDDCQQRILEREGIPMYLSFEHSGPAPTAVRDEGAALVPLIGHYREELAPASGDDDEPALINVLQVLAIAHFESEDTQ